MPDKGWLKDQFDETDKQIGKWPEWMRREAGIAAVNTSGPSTAAADKDRMQCDDAQEND